MIIKIFDVALNVGSVKKVLIKPIKRTRNIKRRLFLSSKEEYYVYDIIFEYIDDEGKPDKFTWSGSPTQQEAEKYFNEILKQVKEVELEKVSAEFENAILKG